MIIKDNITDVTIIKLNKTKLTIFILFSVIMLSLSIYMSINPYRFVSVLFKNSIFIRLIGIIGSLLIIFFIPFLAYKLFSIDNGLVLDNEGLTNNYYLINFGKIYWKDIIGIKTFQLGSSKLFLIQVSNNDYYLNKLKSNYWLRNAYIYPLFLIEKININKYGAISSIYPKLLKINFEELEKLIFEYYKRYGKDK